MTFAEELIDLHQVNVHDDSVAPRFANGAHPFPCQVLLKRRNEELQRESVQMLAILASHRCPNGSQRVNALVGDCDFRDFYSTLELLHDELLALFKRVAWLGNQFIAQFLRFQLFNDEYGDGVMRVGSFHRVFVVNDVPVPDSDVVSAWDDLVQRQDELLVFSFFEGGLDFEGLDFLEEHIPEVNGSFIRPSLLVKVLSIQFHAPDFDAFGQGHLQSADFVLGDSDCDGVSRELATFSRPEDERGVRKGKTGFVERIA